MVKPLDHIDAKIMAELARDGRLTTSELSEKVGLSPSPCWQRVRRLERDGYIRGYYALLDQKLLGFSETVLIDVTLDKHDDDILDNFGRALAEMPEVLEAYLTTGEFDYFIKVAVEGTAGFEEFLLKKLYKIPGVRHTRTSFAIRCLKSAHSRLPTGPQTRSAARR